MDAQVAGRRTRPLLTGVLGLVIGAALLAAPVAPAPGADGPRAATAKRACGKPAPGSARMDSLNGGKRSDRLAGGRGNDGLEGRAGDDCLSGGRGNDILSGGSGDDSLRGGADRDHILAGPGEDRVSAGRGNDLVAVRDGVSETVRCGRGRDLVNADETDALRGCEIVHHYALSVEWVRFILHWNAYGARGVFSSGPGWCAPALAYAANCKGKSEEGPPPFQAGQDITMDWDRSERSGQDGAFRAGSTAFFLGHSDPGWVYLDVTGGVAREIVDPAKGVFRTGDGGGVGTQGGPLAADLSFHNYPVEPRRNGYSLGLRGWIQVIRF
jgi:hypothetical protein